MSSLAKNKLNADAMTVIREEVDNRISFNVMPDRPVTETLHIKEYRVGPGYAEAHFNRRYESAMLKSPSHLIFLTAVVHLQKIIYVYGCHHLKLGYDPYGSERLKIWPTHLEVNMQKMIRDESDLVHRVYFDAFERIAFKRYHLKVRSNVNDILHIDGETPLFVL